MITLRTFAILLIILMAAGLANSSVAGEKIAVNTSVDLYNRYVWRGLDIANTPSMQPSLSLGFCSFEFGIWGAYTLSNESSESDEIDFWLSYTADLKNGASITAMATDYYYPNAGIRFFNFNDHDALIDDSIPDPGAHLIELGLSLTGPTSFPVTVSGYINVYNEAGNNTYFQVDYPVAVNGTDLTFFCGGSGGSKDNPGYYGTDELNVINVGVTAAREIKVSEDFSLPLSVSFIVNPREEISHMLVGFSF